MKASILILISELHSVTDNFFKMLSNYTKINDYEIIVIEDSEEPIFVQTYFDQFNFNNLKFYRTSHKMGYGRATNFGLQFVTCNVLIFINDDIILTQNCLEILVEDIVKNKCDAVQPKLIYPQTNRIQSTGHVFTRYSNAHAFENADSSAYYVNLSGTRAALTTALSATRTELFLNKKFDSTYYNAWKGMEYFLKLTTAGYKCFYDATAIAYHIRNGARGMYKIDEKMQSAYFWSNWQNKIKEDLPKYWELQLANIDRNHEYILINLSNHTLIENTISKAGFAITDTINYLHYSGLDKIDFFKVMPIRISDFNSNIIYCCNNFIQIINNKVWFSLRSHMHDIILDLSGNVITLPNP